MNPDIEQIIHNSMEELQSLAGKATADLGEAKSRREREESIRPLCEYLRFLAQSIEEDCGVV